jgi:uncharacterized glyoxalase superfamily protein PhnB
VALLLEVGNGGAYYERLLGRGVETEGEPANTPWGHRSFRVKDPEGFEISFYQDMNRRRE